MKKAIVALVPVLHSGYINFFKKDFDVLYILGETILEKWERNVNLHRDLRRVDQNEIARLIENANLVPEVKVLEENMISLLSTFDVIVMPDEDVSHWFSEKFLPNKEIIFENIFLRWNKPISTTEMQVPPDRVISEDDLHREFIKKAVELSKQSANWWRQIGTLLVKNGSVIASSYNRHVPTQYNIEVYGDLRADFNAGEYHELSNSIHGEASLIAWCAKEGIKTSGTDLYVTTFPCPTCAKLVVDAGIKRVFYKDGYSLADAEMVLKNAGIEIVLVK